MSGFCHECGKEIQEGQNFCPYCGSKQDVEIVVNELPNQGDRVDQTQPQASQTKSDEQTQQQMGASAGVQPMDGLDTHWRSKKKFIIGGVFAVVIILLVVLSVSVFGSNYEKPIKDICNGLNRGDSDMFFNAFPDYAEEDLEYQYGDEDNYFYSILTDMMEESGRNFKIEYHIDKARKMNAGDLDYVQYVVCEVYNLYYSDVGILDDDYRIAEGYFLDVTFETYDKDRDRSTIATYSVPVGKVDGNWCILTTFEIY